MIKQLQKWLQYLNLFSSSFFGTRDWLQYLNFFFLHFLVPETASIYLIPHIEVKIKTWGEGGGYRKKMMKCNNNVWSVGFYCIFSLSIRSGVFFLSENCSNPFYIRLSPILKAIHHTTFNFLFTHNNRWRLCKEIEFLIFVHLFNTLLFTQLCSRTL